MEDNLFISDSFTSRPNNSDVGYGYDFK